MIVWGESSRCVGKDPYDLAICQYFPRYSHGSIAMIGAAGELRMDKIRIMIADDHALLRAGLRSLLSEQEDMELVAEATDGVEAIEKAKEVQPDVLVLDITMPRKTGIDALGDIRRKCPKTRILVLTMHDDHAYLRSVLAAGGAGYLVKRAADTELLAAIRAIHQGRSYIDVGLDNNQLQRCCKARKIRAPRQPLKPGIIERTRTSGSRTGGSRLHPQRGGRVSLRQRQNR